MKIGSVVLYTQEHKDHAFDQVKSMGLKTCQLVCWDMSMYTDENAASIMRQMSETGVIPSAVWAGYSGYIEWNFTKGPITLGVVPHTLRAQRIADLKAGADFAAKIGVKAIISHFGFLPENLTDYTFNPVVSTIREIGEYCKNLGLEMWFETGQETPVTLLRVLTATGLDNLGINLDPANLMMYGKGNPIDALEVFGKYVKNIHGKDGNPPTNPFELGQEKRIGDGMVRYPEFIAKLKRIGFDGEIIIEREISEDEGQRADIEYAIKKINEWWNNN